MSNVSVATGHECEARQFAEDALEALVPQTDQFTALGPDHPHHIHVLFSELYVCSATHWLRVLAEHNDCEYHYRFIAAFFDLYRRHVIEQLDSPVTEIAPHWRLYHNLARRLSIRSPISAHLLLISVATRAHVRFDLGVGMYAVEGAMAQQSGNYRTEHSRLFGKLSREAFFAAALDYVDRHRARQFAWRWAVLSLFRAGLFGLKPIWLAAMQGWRRRSYEELKN